MFALVLILSITLFASVNCAAPLAKIVNGDTANDGQFSYQISLQLNGSHICGGSILDETHILTASHCLLWSDNTRITADMISIRAGSNVLGIDGQVRQAKNFYTHEKFMLNLNDVAIVELTEPLEFNVKVQPIEINCNETIPGDKVTISGWGKTSDGGKRSEILQWTTLTAISMDECDKLSGLGFKQILCLSHPAGVGTCQGDSGGPGVSNGKIVAVASVVAKTCASRKPDGYARVSLYCDWIAEKMAL